MAAVSSVRLELFGPGMTRIHRAGLLGLVSTLRWIERNVPKTEHPPGVWMIEPYALVLDWHEPENAEAFFTRLYELSFQRRDGQYYLPGQFPLGDPHPSVLAKLHVALARTFYAHGPTTRGKKLRTHVVTVTIDEEDTIITYDVWEKFRHAEAVVDLLAGKAYKGETGRRLSPKPVAYKSAIVPGAFARHEMHKNTVPREAVQNVLCLHFAIVGCQSLLGPGSSGVLVVPEPRDLASAGRTRQALVPRTATQCHVSGAADAVLQAELRLRMTTAADVGGMPSCTGTIMVTKPWARQIKIRSSICVARPDDKDLDRYETILQAMPTRRIRRRSPDAKDPATHFWVASECRNLFAQNLAENHRWYNGFHGRFINNDITAQTLYERKELQTMVKDIQWDEDAERALVATVHEALRRRYGAIATENEENPVAMRKRMSREFDRWRLGFAGAKTQATFRHVITDLWSRAGGVRELRDSWEQLLPFLSEARWQHGRDLALLALASYRGRGADEVSSDDQVQKER